MSHPHRCHIIPPDVLAKLADDPSIPAESRQSMSDSAKLETTWRGLRTANTLAVRKSLVAMKDVSDARFSATLAKAPTVTLFDSKNTNSLPGSGPLSPAQRNKDATAKRAFQYTTDVAKFYKDCFARNSIDGAGMTMVSSIHYGVNYQNAFWTGYQMTYGDGDGQVLIDFTTSSDVIGHELTHAVTQYTAGLNYTDDEAGGLNESVSDAFGSMFRQWLNKQDVKAADWLIGADILGPWATAKGYTCLRNMADPGDKHAMTPITQPAHYRDYRAGMDPHVSSGIPNYAFYLAATAIGGYSWDKAGKIWYEALTSPMANPASTFKEFADLTRFAAKSLFAGDTAVYDAVNDAWTTVGVP